MLTQPCGKKTVADGAIFSGKHIDEKGMPCIEDLFLDIAVLPSGQVITLDADELQDALDKGEITADDFDHAYNIHNQIINSEWVDVRFLKRLCDKLLSDFGTATTPESQE